MEQNYVTVTLCISSVCFWFIFYIKYTETILSSSTVVV